MGKRVNQRELAEICGVSDVTIWEWQRDGLPIASQGARGEANVYDTGGVIEFLIQRALARAGTAKARIELELLEVQLRKNKSEEALREGRLVPADQVEPIWLGRVLAAAAYMAGRASHLAGVLEVASGIKAKRAELKASDAQFLTLLGVRGAAIQDALESFLAEMPPASVQRLYQAMGVAELEGASL